MPNIIKWCVDNDFIQQALTFTAEEMPGYFWKSGLFKASVSEKEKYDKYLMAKSPNKKNNNSCIKQYSENSSKYAYEWMIKYLLHYDSDSNEKEGKVSHIIIQNYGIDCFKQIKIPFKNIKFEEFNAALIIWEKEQPNGRAISNMKNGELFREVMTLYFLLKR